MEITKLSRILSVYHKQKYLEKIRRLCLLMCRMAEEDDQDGINKVSLRDSQCLRPVNHSGMRG